MNGSKSILASFVFVFAVCGGLANGQGISWTKVNGPYSGQIQVLTIDRTGDVFAAAFDGRVEIFRLTDGRGEWKQVLSLLSYGYESAMAADSSGNVYYGDMDAGLFKSTDKGTTWFKTSLAGGISALTVISGNRICAGGRHTISISSDGGETWMTRTVRTDPVEVLSITEDDSGKIYAGFRAIPPSKTSPGYPGGVYVSSDSGKTWESYGLSATISSMAFDKKRQKLFSLLHSSLIYSADQERGVWTRDAAGIPYWVNGISNLFVDRNGDVGAVTNAGVYMYDDLTSSWRSVTPAVSLDSITTAAFDRQGRTYVGTSFNGVFLLDSSASTWIQCGILPVSITSLGMDYSGNVYAGTDDGIFEFEHNTGSWFSESDGLSRARVYRIRLSSFDKMVYASTSAGFFYLPDMGNYWIPLTKQWTYDFRESPTYTYIGTPGGILELMRSLELWTPLGSIGLPLTSIYCLALDRHNDLFAGTQNAGVFVSTNGGISWSQTGVYSPLIFYSAKTIEIDSSENIFVGTDTAGAFCSNDSGMNYRSISSISGKTVTCFLVDHPPKYFAGTSDRGVFVSTDCGMSWHPANTGLTDSSVAALVLDTEGYLYAGTKNGIFRSNSIATGVHETGTKPSGFSLSQNYPNPFNPTTVIEFVVPGSESQIRAGGEALVTLKIYDVLGRLVKTLVNKVESPGSHLVTFDAAGLASGVYFYRLTAGSYVMTKKMVLIR